MSRLWVGLWLAAAALNFIATRPIAVAVYRRLLAAGVLAQRYVLFGSTSELLRIEQFMARWERSAPPASEIAAIFLDGDTRNLPSNFKYRHLIKGMIDQFENWRGDREIEGGIAVIRPDDRRCLEPLIEKLSAVPLDVDIVAGFVDQSWAERKITKMAGIPVVRVMTRPLDPHQRLTKRLEDVVIAVAALIAFAPFMLIVALLLRLDSPGPVFFRQARHGFDNRSFDVFKFRTMFQNGDAPATVAQAQRNDPRVTRIGRFLRRTSLDELPQLFNVLRGDMSIVGPRPHAVEHNTQYAPVIDSYLARHRIRPGITGWAQVNGLRGETDTVDKMRRRVEHDLFYTDNWSFVFDVKIMLLTLGCLVHDNAY